MTLSEAIKHEARGLGFDAVGISRVDSSQPSAISSQPTPLTPYPATPLSRLLFNRLMEWLQRGYHGTMEWMERDPARRADPQQVLSGCRSVISLGMNYYTPHRADERSGYGRMVAVCGRPGFGKSRAIAEAVKQDPNLIVIQASRVLGPSGLLQELCEPLRESDKGLLRALMRRIRARLSGSGRGVIVDDAHTLGFAALDVLRTIYDATGVGIVLVGIMALKRHLTGTSEEMEQLASRVAGRIWELPEFNEADLHLLLQAVVKPDDLAAALELFGHDKQLQSSARRTCNILEIAGRLALSSGGNITIQHLKRALKAA